jgi:hypothetical protein
MKNFRRTLGVLLLIFPAVAGAQDRAWNLKTNLLSDAAMTLNGGVEFRTGDRTSLDIPLSYNSWTFSENRKWKHVLVQPEIRLWGRQTFDGSFFGVHAHYASYNVGNLPRPFSAYMREHRFEGWLVGAGVSYGYLWNFNPRWALEATLGVGYAYLDYDRFICSRCGEHLGGGMKHYFGPTKAGVSLIFSLGQRTSVARQFPVSVVLPLSEPLKPQPQIYEPHFTASFIIPEVEEVKTRNESGSAYLDFAVGRSDIVPGFENNAAELQKIDRTIESIKNDPNATITAITITGYASPEGSASSNWSLSERRAQALRGRIGSVHGLPNTLFSAHGAGEEWAGLEELLAGSSLAEKEQIQEIIHSQSDLDVREQRIRSLGGGAPYRRMVAEFYPALRRSDYTISYTVIPFTVDQGKEVLQRRPGDLSLNELFLIANTYPSGGAAFFELFETAAHLFPESDVANLNAAAAALGREDASSAARYLAKVRDRNESYWNNAGMVSWLRGDKARAAEAFTRAGASGAENAAELRAHLVSLPDDSIH